VEPAVDLPVPPAQAASLPGPTNGDQLEKLLTNFRVTTLASAAGLALPLDAADGQQRAIDGPSAQALA